MDTTPIKQLPWKKDRGYMLAQDVTLEQDPNLITFHGYLKGTCVNANQLVHVTGFDDFEIESIRITPTRKRVMEEEGLVQHSITPESMFPFSKVEEHTEDLLSALAGLKIEQNNTAKPVEMEEEDDGFEDQSDDEEEMEFD